VGNRFRRQKEGLLGWEGEKMGHERRMKSRNTQCQLQEVGFKKAYRGLLERMQCAWESPWHRKGNKWKRGRGGLNTERTRKKNGQRQNVSLSCGRGTAKGKSFGRLVNGKGKNPRVMPNQESKVNALLCSNNSHLKQKEP